MKTTKNKHILLKSIIITLISLIVMGLIFCTVCIILAMQDPYKDKYSTIDTVEINANLVGDIAEAAVFGKDYTANDQEVNSYIRKTIDSKEDSKLKDLAVYFHGDNKADIYGRANLSVPVLNYTGDFGVYCNAEFYLDPDENVLEVTLSNTKLGALSVPDSILSNILTKTFKDRLKCEGTVIYLPVSLETNVEGVDIKVSLECFTPNEGSVTLKSNKVLADTLDSATDKAKEWISEHKQQLREYGDDMAQWLDDNKDKLSEYESKAEEWVDNNKDTISEYENKLEQWVNENSDTVSDYTAKAKKWLESHVN